MDPIIGGALIGAGSHLLGGLFGMGSSNKANKTNLRIARENNALQRELANQKYAKDLEQWHRENAYNSPLAQSQRLLEAGLNPALQNISTGQAQSSPEMALAQTTAGQVAPITDGSFIGRAGDSVFASMSAMEDIKGKNIDNRTRATENLIRIQNLGEQMKGTKLKNYFQKLQNDAFGVLNELEVSSRKQNLEMQKYQIERQIADNTLLNKQLSVFDANQRIYVQKSMAEIALLAAQRHLTKSQVANLVMQNGYIAEQIRNLRVDTDLKYATFDSVVTSAYNASLSSYWDTIPNIDKLSDYDFYEQRHIHPKAKDWWTYDFRKFMHDISNNLPSLRFKIK